jgi:regulator of PEP synthase PpsR (kinase-PPPase family)
MAKKKRSKSTAKSTRGVREPGYHLHIISEVSGNVASRLVAAALARFPDVCFTKVFHVFQDSVEKVMETLDRISPAQSLVLHTLVDPEAKRALRDHCVIHRIPYYDLTSGVVEFISMLVGTLPTDERLPHRETDEVFYRRIEAIDFAEKHDDGASLTTLDAADIVLVGVSRVSKSPTSIYLASHGFKTANVSITPGTPFPRELAKVAEKVVALTIQPKRLQEIRASRFGHNDLCDDRYYNLRDVIQEVTDSEAEYRRRKYPVIDITHMTVEEIAAQVLRELQLSPVHRGHV